jgi:hypothetical protein
MFYFALAKVVEEGTPTRIMFQIFGDMLGQQNVSGVATVHHPLGNIDSGPRNVGLFIQIRDLIYRPAVNSHAHVKRRMALQCFGNLEPAQHRRFRSVAKDERATIAGWQSDQLAFCFGFLELFGPANNRLQRPDLFALLVNVEL